MARKKRNGEGDEAPPPAGHNVGQLDDDQSFALTAQHAKAYKTALAAKKAADAALKNVCKLAKSELGATAVDDIKDVIAAETPEGEGALIERRRAEAERHARVARWLGLPEGAQGAMFEDRTPAVDRAFANGKRDGLAGNPCKPVHAPETEQYRRYMEGFHEGQAVLAKGFKAMPVEAVGDAVASADEEKLLETAH